MDIKLIAICVTVAIMMIILVGLLLVDYVKNKSDYKDGSWLFTNFWTSLYPVLFKEDELITAKKFGIHTDEYLSNCKSGGIEPNLRRYIMCYLGAILILFAGIFIFLITFLMDMDVIVSLCIVIIAMLLCVIVLEGEKKKAENASKKARESIVEEMPRFLDLVESALFIGMPVESALMLAAESVPGILSEELIKAADEATTTEKSWQESLDDVANKYNVDVLTNFVLDVTTSYKKGINIYESVVRQNVLAKQAKMMEVEARASKTKTVVLLPVAIFKLVPIILVFLFPVIEMLKGF